MRVLLLENQDSFTWNVIESLPCHRHEVTVWPGRRAASCLPLLDAADVIVVGPGPTDPVRAGLVEVVREAAARRRPLLGICLGHQALGLAFGARLTRVPPVHGKTSTVTFGPSRCFPSFSGPQVVMRYHSLALTDVLPPLAVIATTAEGLPMAVEHVELPMAGVQFHPDSHATPRGVEMIADFFRAVR